MNSDFLRNYFLKDCRYFLEDLLVRSSLPLPRVHQLGMAWVVLSMEVMITQIYSFLDNCQMVCLSWAGLWGRKLSLQKLISTFSSVNSDKWMEEKGCRSRVPINSFFGFCNRPGFHSRWNFHKFSIMVFPDNLGVLMVFHICSFQVFHLTVLVVRVCRTHISSLPCLSMQLQLTRRMWRE